MSTDVDPNAEPAKLNPDNGLDPNQHDPLEDGNWLDRKVNKHWETVFNASAIADAFLTTALTGSLGTGLLVYAAYKLTAHLLKRWDVNIAKLFYDPLGLFGGSAFNSTRYFHYFNQYSQERSEWLPDPINTYAAVAVAQNQEVGSYVVNAIQQGKGNNLKRYYQYSTLRFGNRNWQWRLDRAKDVDRTILKINNNLLMATTPMPKRFEIVHQDNEYVEYGTSYLAWIKNSYGLDQFHTEYQGKHYDILQPPVKQTDGSFAIAEADDGSKLTVNSIPIKPSKGIIWWTNSQAPKNLQVEKDYITEDLTIEKLPPNYPNDQKDIGKLVWVDEDYRWTNPYDTKADEGKDPNTSNTSNTTLSGGLLYSKFVTLDRIYEETKIIHYGFGLTREKKITHYVFKVTVVVSYVGYDTENFFYIEQDGTNNNQEVANLYNVPPVKPKIKPVIASNTSRVFKFYPYIPIREWTKGRHADYHDFPIVPSKFTQAVKTINDLTSEDDAENTEANVDKNKKVTKKHNRDELKKKTKDGKTLKSLQRKLSHGLASKRKVKYRQLWHMKKPMSNSTIHRHVEQMAKLLNTDIDYESVNFTSSEYYDRDIYDGGHYVSQLLMPAVNFASNNKETHRYLYSFFNRLYNLYGKEEQVKNWYATVQSATSLSDIAINKLEWVNDSTMDYGGMSWLFINKFKMTGNVRKLKRNHRYYDVLRGKPVSISSIKDLQSIVEPLHELAEDKHYKSKNGIEYCIGGQGYDGDGIYENGNSVYEAFRNYDYTFIARQSGENEISVIAIAGLSFTTKLSELTRWCRAFHDLGLHYERNKQKYIDKNANPNSTDEIHRRESKKHNHYNVISHWGIIPLDYHSLCRIGGTELERFAERAILHYGFVKSEQKGKRKGLKPVMIVAQIIIFIISVILALPSGGSSLTLNAVAQAVVQAAVVALIVNLAIRFVIMPLLKLLGIKGLIALIIIIAIMIAASMLGGNPPDTQSVLPYASEVGKQTATQIANQVASETASFTMESLKQMVSNAISEALKQTLTTGFGLASTFSQAAIQGMNKYNQQEMASIQNAMQAEQEAFNQASNELQEKQEEIVNHIANFDVKEVLSGLRTRFKMYNPDAFINSNTMPDEYSASYAYLENFFQMKLNLDPETFDPVRSLDFSFNS